MNDVQSKIPRVCVKALFRCGEYVLYVKNPNGVRDIPGGHVEFGEDTMTALKRELKEELGYELTGEPVLYDVWTYLNDEKTAHRVNIIYLIDLPTRTPFYFVEDQQGAELVWLHKSEIREQHFLPAMEHYLLQAVS